MVLGVIITGLGPLIPYLADYEERMELQYSFLFTCRAVGYILSTFIARLTEKWLKLHQLVALALLLQCFMIPFCFAFDLRLKGALLFISSIGTQWMNIGINLCLISLMEKHNLHAWMQIAHGTFGIGGLLGPYFVSLLEIRTFIAFGLTALLVIPIYLLTPSPEEKVEEGVK